MGTHLFGSVFERLWIPGMLQQRSDSTGARLILPSSLFASMIKNRPKNLEVSST